MPFEFTYKKGYAWDTVYGTCQQATWKFGPHQFDSRLLGIVTIGSWSKDITHLGDWNSKSDHANLQ